MRAPSPPAHGHRAPTTDDSRSDSRGSCRAARPQGPWEPRCVPPGAGRGPDLHRGPGSRPGHPPAAADDDLTKTVHYGVVAEEVVDVVAGRAGRSDRDTRRTHRPEVPEARRGPGGGGRRPQAGRADHRSLRRRDHHHHPEPSMTASSPRVTATRPYSRCPPPWSSRWTPPTPPCHNPKRAVISLGAQPRQPAGDPPGRHRRPGGHPGPARQGGLPGVRDGAVGRRAGQPAVVLQRGGGREDDPAAVLAPGARRTRSRRRSTGSGRSAGARAPSTWTSSRTRTWSPTTRVLTLPHPRAHERAFVLVPWHDVEPEAQLPGRGAGRRAAGRRRPRRRAPRADLELRLPE